MRRVVALVACASRHAQAAIAAERSIASSAAGAALASLHLSSAAAPSLQPLLLLAARRRVADALGGGASIWPTPPSACSSGSSISATTISSSQHRAYSRLAAAAERARRRAAASRRSRGGGALVPRRDASEVDTTGDDGDNPPLAPAAFDLPNELSLSRTLDHPALIVTRAVEWGTVLLGFEQATKYTVYDEQGNVVALMAEDDGFGKALTRQLLRTRRPFTTTVLSPDGSEVLFKVKRPAYLISSSMTVLDADDNAIGSVQQRWHPWRRNYDLYLGRRQMAQISGGLLAWEFELKDEAGRTLALIDR